MHWEWERAEPKKEISVKRRKGRNSFWRLFFFSLLRSRKNRLDPPLVDSEWKAFFFPSWRAVCTGKCLHTEMCNYNIFDGFSILRSSQPAQPETFSPNFYGCERGIKKWEKPIAYWEERPTPRHLTNNSIKKFEATTSNSPPVVSPFPRDHSSTPIDAICSDELVKNAFEFDCYNNSTADWLGPISIHWTIQHNLPFIDWIADQFNDERWQLCHVTNDRLSKTEKSRPLLLLLPVWFDLLEIVSLAGPCDFEIFFHFISCFLLSIVCVRVCVWRDCMTTWWRRHAVK